MDHTEYPGQSTGRRHGTRQGLKVDICQDIDGLHQFSLLAREQLWRCEVSAVHIEDQTVFVAKHERVAHVETVVSRLGVWESLDTHRWRHRAIQRSIPAGAERLRWQPPQVAHWGLGVGNALEPPERMAVVRDHRPPLNIPGRCGDHQPARDLQYTRGEAEEQKHRGQHRQSLQQSRAELSQCCGDVENTPSYLSTA